MQISMIDGVTRLLGKTQGFLGLPIRDAQVNETVLGLTNSMTSAWRPTDKELEALNKGACVHVRLIGSMHPPINVEVGPAPEEE